MFVQRSRKWFIEHGGFCSMLESAFPLNISREVPDVSMIVACARVLDVYDSAKSILEVLARRLVSFRERIQQSGDGLSKGEAQERRRRVAKLGKYVCFLRVPRPQWKLRFTDAWNATLHEAVRQSMGVVEQWPSHPLDNAQPTPPPVSGVQIREVVPAPAPAPAADPAPTAPVLPVHTPQHRRANAKAISADAFRSGMRKRVRPVEGCDKCAVARLCPEARREYNRDGGVGVHKDISRRRACPLFEHGISRSDLESIASSIDESLGRNARREKINEFMLSEFGTSPLGDEHSDWKVSRYTMMGDPPTLVAVDDLGVPNASKRHVKVFAGFQLVDAPDAAV
jgi:hypothetical protein